MGLQSCIDTLCDVVFFGNNHFYVPNALSPDRNYGEVKVGRFQVTGNNIRKYTLNIFSPQGDIIMTIDEQCDGELPKKYWDGTMFNNGTTRLPVGAYLWKAHYEFMNEDSLYTKVGNVTVIR